jgi:hypothetical protein
LVGVLTIKRAIFPILVAYFKRQRGVHFTPFFVHLFNANADQKPQHLLQYPRHPVVSLSPCVLFTMEQSSAAMNFIHPQLTPTVATKDEELSYASIGIARTQLHHDNAAAVFTLHGGGIHGHLALTMTAAEHLAAAGVPFVAPINPTADPVLDSKSKMQSLENVRRHEVTKREFQLYHDVDKALCKQLIEATPPTYLVQDLRDLNLGYASGSSHRLTTWS